MSTFLQFHLLTAFPPSNLNRDENGRPKTAIYGGTQRLRLTSQSIKRAWRTTPSFQDALKGYLGERSARLGGEIVAHLIGRGASPDVATDIARTVAGKLGSLAAARKGGDPTRTGQLLFLAPSEKARALAIADALFAGESDVEARADDILLYQPGAVDIAMFGRMLADHPGFSGEAAVQVAHALTTHKAQIEDDFLVALDDLQPQTELGTTYIANQQFGAGVFYLYVCVNVDLLVANLGELKERAPEVARAGLAALVEAMLTEVPRGKQASYASRARPLYALAERGTQQPRTLAAAFLRDVDAQAAPNRDLAEGSIQRLAQYRTVLDRVYGSLADARCEFVATTERGEGSADALRAFAMESVG